MHKGRLEIASRKEEGKKRNKPRKIEALRSEELRVVNGRGGKK